MSTRAAPLIVFLDWLRGPMIWAAHFFTIYGAETVVCMASPDPGRAMRVTVVATTAIGLGGLLLPHIRVPAGAKPLDDAGRDFMRTLSFTLSVLSAGAMLAAAAAAWRVPACMPPS